MVGSKPVRLRVGVVGLGRLWETRHKPSLARMEDRFRVTAVYDQVCRRAEIEAGQIGCAATEGLSALVERPDVDVIYLLSRQWFGLHPIALACAAGKPVYCALAAGRRPRRARGAGPAGRVERHRLHAGVRPAVLSGDAAAQGAAGDRPRAAAAGRRVTRGFTGSTATRCRVRPPRWPRRRS